MLRIFLFLLLWSTAGVTQAAATIMVFGDSISAGYGLRQGTGWVDLLQRRLTSEKYDYKVINASLTGDTTVGGKNRIGRALAQSKPDIVILELGANDGLRGANVETIRANLAAMITECRKRGAKVLLVGMQLPPNYGSAYTEKFRSAYSSLAESLRVSLVPFLLEGFAADSGAFQSDGIHPNASVQSRMLDTIWIQLRPMLSRAQH
ncbi:MAG TPA: arylesterase [Burkholderiales bacterium]|jgi:acyl-CoA thioesterase-1|nr:arylesterase [Burkholderiales bacterium]